MKANEAPEKIYISNFDIEALPKNEQLSERWYEVSTEDTDIEYTRTDAFIEKACDWIEDHIYEYLKINRTFNEPDYDPKLIEDFINYLNFKKINYGK